MAEILKPGRIKAMASECDYCEATISFLLADIKQYGTVLTVECPACGENIVIARAEDYPALSPFNAKKWYEL